MDGRENNIERGDSNKWCNGEEFFKAEKMSLCVDLGGYKDELFYCSI